MMPRSATTITFAATSCTQKSIRPKNKGSKTEKECPLLTDLFTRLKLEPHTRIRIPLTTRETLMELSKRVLRTRNLHPTCVDPTHSIALFLVVPPSLMVKNANRIPLKVKFLELPKLRILVVKDSEVSVQEPLTSSVMTKLITTKVHKT